LLQVPEPEPNSELLQRGQGILEPHNCATPKQNYSSSLFLCSDILSCTHDEARLWNPPWISRGQRTYGWRNFLCIKVTTLSRKASELRTERSTATVLAVATDHTLFYFEINKTLEVSPRRFTHCRFRESQRTLWSTQTWVYGSFDVNAERRRRVKERVVVLNLTIVLEEAYQKHTRSKFKILPYDAEHRRGGFKQMLLLSGHEQTLFGMKSAWHHEHTGEGNS